MADNTKTLCGVNTAIFFNPKFQHMFPKKPSGDIEKKFGFGEGDEFEGGKYVLKSLVGSGSFGEVWISVNTTSGEESVLKFLNITDQEDERQALMEIETMRSVSGDSGHSNVIQMFDTFQLSDSGERLICVVMQNAGVSLKKRLAETYHSTGIPEKELKTVAKQVLEGIVFLHCKNITHADIKPENICWNEAENKSVIIDLACSAVTQEYKSPEVINDLECCEYPASLDVWALGASLYELAFNFILFGNASDGAQQMSEISRFCNLTVAERTNEVIERDSKINPKSMARINAPRIKAFLEFLAPMLEMDPSKRATAAECLAHPWLAGI